MGHHRKDIESAEQLIIPGVGAFGAVMTAMSTDVQRLKQRIERNQPTLGFALACNIRKRKRGSPAYKASAFGRTCAAFSRHRSY